MQHVAQIKKKRSQKIYDQELQICIMLEKITKQSLWVYIFISPPQLDEFSTNGDNLLVWMVSLSGHPVKMTPKK